jgi:Zn-dependent protease with chaperone function
MARQKLKNLHDDEYEHPFDHKALEALEKTPALDTILQKLWEKVGENFLRVQYTGSCIQVTENNFGNLYALFKEVKAILNVPGDIELYLMQNPYPNAFTIGVENPIIVITTKSVDLMNDDELVYLIGHEMGHIKSKHMLYQQTANLITMFGGFVGNLTLGIGDIITTAVQVPLLYWSRMAEFTSDRAGLLTCQDIRVATSVNMKLAGLPEKYMDNPPVDSFLAQAREFKDYDYNTLNKLFRLFTELNPWQGMTHPWTVMRAAELMKWIDEGGYERVLSRQTFDPATMSDAIRNPVCPKCNTELKPGKKFCHNCGAPQETDTPVTPAGVCPACKAEVQPGKKFCHNCGAPQEQGTGPAPAPAAVPACPACGTPFAGDAQFCQNCGKKRESP